MNKTNGGVGGAISTFNHPPGSDGPKNIVSGREAAAKSVQKS